MPLSCGAVNDGKSNEDGEDQDWQNPAEHIEDKPNDRIDRFSHLRREKWLSQVKRDKESNNGCGSQEQRNGCSPGKRVVQHIRLLNCGTASV